MTSCENVFLSTKGWASYSYKSAGCPLFGRDECVCDVDFVTEPAYQYVRNSRAFKPKGTLSITICTAIIKQLRQEDNPLSAYVKSNGMSNGFDQNVHT